MWEGQREKLRKEVWVFGGGEGYRDGLTLLSHKAQPGGRTEGEMSTLKKWIENTSRSKSHSPTQDRFKTCAKINLSVIPT
eukprot:jgi/Botrbrau1/9357/Bobra.354_2s0014.1